MLFMGCWEDFSEVLDLDSCQIDTTVTFKDRHATLKPPFGVKPRLQASVRHTGSIRTIRYFSDKGGSVAVINSSFIVLQRKGLLLFLDYTN